MPSTTQGVLCTTPILAYPDLTALMMRDTDASGIGVVAVLGYATWALKKPERNYYVTQRELLGMIFMVRKFRAYLARARFNIRMDHSALLWLLEVKKSEGQMAR